LLAVTLSAVVIAACSSGSTTEGKRVGDCPVTPVPVVVSVDQWGDIVDRLAGDCGDVTTIITGSSADPHDYEPTPADTAKFSDAKLVVVNGLDYDHWAEQAIDTLDDTPAVVDGGKVVGLEAGDNPHIWYGPRYVTEVSDAITAELKELAPDAASYLDERQTAWRAALQPYDAEIARIKAVSAGKTYGATESVFDYMAEAVALANRTPKGYQSAAANESDPTPADVNAFEEALTAKQMTVLVFNTQTEGAVPDQIRRRAEQSDLPVVDVTETVPPGTDSFVRWQLEQLKELATALGA
jgi:zinc/manganese transport system substrate-binding protein